MMQSSAHNIFAIIVNKHCMQSVVCRCCFWLLQKLIKINVLWKLAPVFHFFAFLGTTVAKSCELDDEDRWKMQERDTSSSLTDAICYKS